MNPPTLNSRALVVARRAVARAAIVSMNIEPALDGVSSRLTVLDLAGTIHRFDLDPADAQAIFDAFADGTNTPTVTADGDRVLISMQGVLSGDDRAGAGIADIGITRSHALTIAHALLALAEGDRHE